MKRRKPRLRDYAIGAVIVATVIAWCTVAGVAEELLWTARQRR